jgi:hypothetical protein
MGDDPLSGQPDAAEQLREQVVRLAREAEPEGSVLSLRRIGKLSRRPDQLCRRYWTIGKVSRRNGHGLYPFLRLA